MLISMLKNYGKLFCYITLFATTIAINTAQAEPPQEGYIFAQIGGGFLSDAKLKEITNTAGGTASPTKEWGTPLTESYGLGYYSSPINSYAISGVELTYNRFNEITTFANATISGQTADATEKAKAWSTTFNVVANIDLTDDFSFMFKVGGGYVNVKRNVTIITQRPINNVGGDNSSGIGGLAALGFQVYLFPHVSLRAEVDGFISKPKLTYAQALAGLLVYF